ncbi:MAG: type II secretion system protein [Planctomycetes bacterium]|nr:type II secretion system protein [Planctomycetota bacterium]NOG53838.1 type II secretion system protein [Planctomycetota bacterium]
MQATGNGHTVAQQVIPTVIDRRSYATRPIGFTLVEVLMATIILALGLIGVAAVFPAVIAQQKRADDLSQAVSAAAGGEAVLSSRMDAFADAIQRTPAEFGANWVRINTYDPLGDTEPYLQAPFVPGKFDIRLRVQEKGYRITKWLNGSDMATFSNVRIPSRTLPIDKKDAGDMIVNILLGGGAPQLVSYQPDPDEANEKFKVVKGGASRIDDLNQDNMIDWDNGVLTWHVMLNNGETVDRVWIDYVWRNDKIISHRDRLSPSESPRYGWDIAIRRGVSGVPQYTMFVYRYEGGPSGAEFYPEIPNRFNTVDEGMLRLGGATIAYESDGMAQKAYLQVSRDMKEALRSGSYILPYDGAGPVEIRRWDEHALDGNGAWELVSPPTRTLADGTVEQFYGGEALDFWYVPLSVPALDRNGMQIGSWKIRPLLAFSKQFGV